MTSKKDLKISNVKGLLIILVVFGHLLEIYKDNYNELFRFIYAFHMPLFIFVSGFLAKRMRVSKIVNLVLLYLIFQTFFNWVLHLTGDYPNLQFTYGEPHFHLWYIVSLGFWYGVALIINKFDLQVSGKWIVFLVLCLISFISRWFTDDIVDGVNVFYDNFSSYTLSYQRTLSFMPFFFMGFFMNKKAVQSMYHSIGNVNVAITIFVVTMFLTFLYIQNVPGTESMFRGSHGVPKIMGDAEGFFSYSIRVAFHYFIAFWLIYLIFNITTSTENILTKWGDHSLTIFLFHPVVVFILRQTEFMEEWDPFSQIAFFLIVTICVSYVLGSSTFTKATKYFCNPYATLKTFADKLFYPIKTNKGIES